MFKSNGQADQSRGDSAGSLLLLCQLRVRRAGRMDGQALGIANIGQVREQLQRLDKFAPAFLAALDLEHDHAARAVRKIFPGLGVVAGIFDPLDLVALL